jgi:outer membrane protein OmpA-like peptidoglycan-associated protein
MIKKIINIFLLLIVALPLYSQSEQKDSVPADLPYIIGIYGGGVYIWNQTELPVLPCEGDCGNYRDGSDLSYYAGIRIGYEIIKDFIFSDFRIYYESRPLALSAQTSPYEVLDPASNQYVPLVREHTIEGDLQYMSLDLGVAINPFKLFPQTAHIPIYFRISVDAGQALMGKYYDNYEEIISPNGITFPDGQKKHLVESGEMSDAQVVFGAIISIMADIKISDNIYFNPEISYRKGLNSVVTNNTWNTDMLRAGIGFRWALNAETFVDPEPEIEPEPEVEELLPEPEIFTSDDLDQEDEEDANSDDNKYIISMKTYPLEISETIVTQTFPLLPYIFFDSSRVEVRDVYTSGNTDIRSFDEMKLPKETLGIYYHILDIVGARMKANENSKLTITGMTDGNEIEDDKIRLLLAEKRAESVRKYLFDKWNIENNRLIVKHRDLPAKATTIDQIEGRQENRRAEIYSDTPTLLAPVVHSKFIEYKAPVNYLVFDVDLRSAGSVKQWQMKIYSGDELIAEQTDDSAPGRSIRFPLKREILSKFASAAEKNTMFRSELTVEMSDGQAETNVTEFKVSKYCNKFEVGRLNLIVFDFDKSDISEFNQHMVTDFITSSIYDNSYTKITGSTDRLGEKEYNKRLSESRAVSVREYIKRLVPLVKIDEVKGIGASNLQFDNDLPEGRFYCRTVLIEVKTPVE